MMTEQQRWARLPSGVVIWFLENGTFVQSEAGEMVRLFATLEGGGRNGDYIGQGADGLLVAYSGKRYLITPDFQIKQVP